MDEPVAPTPTTAAPKPPPRRIARTSGQLLPWEKEERARAAFATLDADEQVGLVEALAIECKKLDTFQMQLMRFVLAQDDTDFGLRPDAQPATWFDPAKHAPAQPIARHELAIDDPLAVAAREQILGAIAPRRAESGWAYDWAPREVVRLPNERDPWRVLENALAGLPPHWDLVEALVEKQLDDGSLQATFTAFAHAYTDRVGAVYPGITLYDAWASRTDLEVPDVDSLGIIHDLSNDWTTWKSVVPEEQHQALYQRIGELFTPALHFRGLRENLARTFVCGTTELRDGYQQHFDNFQSLWESVSSNPADLAVLLPDDAKWSDFLLKLTSQVKTDEQLALRGIRRRYTLDQNGEQVRANLYWLLEQADAYRRLDARK
ncbi:MAG: hypothetical protein K8S98_09235 [Planctomycetes bacterium]|nr:hypothetical protein [Planctomycetota bacterium]